MKIWLLSLAGLLGIGVSLYYLLTEPDPYARWRNEPPLRPWTDEPTRLEIMRSIVGPIVRSQEKES